MRIAQLTPRLSDRDAVGNDVRGIQAALRAAGRASDVFAGDWDPEQNNVRPFEELNDWLQSPRDLLIYHYSIAWPPAPEILRNAKARVVIKSHNVTPPEFFAPYNDGYAEFCRAGRAQLGELLSCEPELLIGDSQFNAGEAQAVGMPAEGCRVIPPFHRCDELFGAYDLRAGRDSGDGARDGGFTVLMTGRIAPNKGYEFLIQAFGRFCELALQEAGLLRDSARAEGRRLARRLQLARLVCLGPQDPELERYYQVLRRALAESGAAARISFPGRVSEDELRAWFLEADAFCVTSEHEGFCVPVIEAMAAGLPVVALDRGAVGETLGGAGILWREADVDLFATSLLRLAKQPELAEALGAMGLQSYADRFPSERIAERWEATMAELTRETTHA